MKTIAIGWMSGHLLDPPDFRFDKEKLSKLIDYVKENNIQTFKSDIDATEFLFNNYKNFDELTMIGSYADGCIAYSANIALRLGIKVNSPSNSIFYCNTDKSLEKCVREKILNNPDLKNLEKEGKIKDKFEFDYKCTQGIHKFILK